MSGLTGIPLVHRHYDRDERSRKAEQAVIAMNSMRTQLHLEKLLSLYQDELQSTNTINILSETSPYVLTVYRGTGEKATETAAHPNGVPGHGMAKRYVGSFNIDQSRHDTETNGSSAPPQKGEFETQAGGYVSLNISRYAPSHRKWSRRLLQNEEACSLYLAVRGSRSVVNFGQG